MISQVRDTGQITDLLAGSRPPVRNQPDAKGLWLASQLCDLTELRSGPAGTAVRLHMWLS